MLRKFRTLLIVIIFVSLVGNSLVAPTIFRAANLQDTTINPDDQNPSDFASPMIPSFPQDYRYLYFANTNMSYHWSLTDPYDLDINCHIYTQEYETPEDEDILGFCDLEIYQLWVDQMECEAALSDSCSQMAINYVSEVEESLETAITLPGPVSYVGLSNCSAWGSCNKRPQLIFGGLEPLATQDIESIYIVFENGTYVNCTENPCTVQMPTTSSDGLKVTYSAISSYGDNTYSDSFEMRNINLGDDGFIFQLMGSQWNSQLPVTAVQWEFFPSVEISQIPWLSEISSADALATQNDYGFLAGNLIQSGSVDASGCPYGGVMTNGAATTCGLEVAHDLMIEYQNRFDNKILDAAEKSRIPPKILKGLIAQESQFWNGWVIKGEFGLGMMTDNGADMLMTWNVPYFVEACLGVFDYDTCSWGYSSLSDYQKDYLKGLSLLKVGTDEEFEVIGQTLAASVGQTGQLVKNITGQNPGALMNYEELWKVTLAIYHGGAGCVGSALELAYEDQAPLTWHSIRTYLQGDCDVVAEYPDWVIYYSE